MNRKTKKEKREKNVNSIRIIRFLVLFLAVAFLAVGVARKEYIEVLQKAVKICLECIGIG